MTTGTRERQATMVRPRLAVLLSGSGSTLQNLIDRIAAGSLAAEIAGVVSSRADAFGLQRAKNVGLNTALNRDDPFAEIREWKVDWVICAGWLHLLTVPDDFRWKVLNVHPSLLPAFGGRGMYGHRVHAAVLAAGCKLSGCTVHFVDGSYDTGPIVAQHSVAVDDDETVASLAEKVQATERELYPRAIAALSRMSWRLDGRRVIGLEFRSDAS